MKPKIPETLLATLKGSGRNPPWRCKLQLPHGRTIYGVEINSEGEIMRVADRRIFSEADIGFSAATAEEIIYY